MLGQLPSGYNKAVHGPYDPAVFYGKADIPLSQVKWDNVWSFFKVTFSTGQGLSASRLAAPQAVLQPYRLRKGHVQVRGGHIISDRDQNFTLITSEPTGAGTTSTCCPSTAAWPPSSRWLWAPPPSSISWTSTASPPTRTWSTTGNPGPSDHWPWWLLVWQM